MSADNNDPSQHRKTVGVYDRPAAADRSRSRVVWIAAAIAIAAAIGWILILG